MGCTSSRPKKNREGEAPADPFPANEEIIEQLFQKQTAAMQQMYQMQLHQMEEIHRIMKTQTGGMAKPGFDRSNSVTPSTGRKEFASPGFTRSSSVMVRSAKPVRTSNIYQRSFLAEQNQDHLETIMSVSDGSSNMSRSSSVTTQEQEDIFAQAAPEREARVKAEKEKAALIAKKKAEKEAHDRAMKELAAKAAKEKANRRAAEKAAHEAVARKVKEEMDQIAAEKAAMEKAKQEAQEKLEREAKAQADRELKEQAEREAAWSNSEKSAMNLLETTQDIKTYEQVVEWFEEQGVRGTHVIYGLDFSSTSELNGEKCNRKLGLHRENKETGLNGYEKIMLIVYKLLRRLDHDKAFEVFAGGTLIGNETVCKPVANVPISDQHKMVSYYRRFRDKLDWKKKSTNTSYSGFIQQAINLSKNNPGKHYTLVLMTDTVTQQTKRDMTSLAQASNYPISVVIIGLGDGNDEAWSKLDQFIANVRLMKCANNISRYIYDINHQSTQKNLIDIGLQMFRHLPQQFAQFEQANKILPS